MTKKTAIELKGISKVYFEGTENELWANNDINLTINEGELVAIIGQSGSGKSTLMNVIGALDKPTYGTYILDGEEVNEISDEDLSDIRNRNIGFVFQNFNLLGRIDARKNIELPMLYAGVSASERKRKSTELLEMVGMGDRGKHMPNELSGGQKQRVAIARALANDPAIILADEPTGALDSKTTETVLEMFTHLHQTKGATIIIITHSHEVAARCDRVVTLVDGKITSDVDRAGNPSVNAGLEWVTPTSAAEVSDPGKVSPDTAAADVFSSDNVTPTGSDRAVENRLTIPDTHSQARSVSGPLEPNLSPPHRNSEIDLEKKLPEQAGLQGVQVSEEVLPEPDASEESTVEHVGVIVEPVESEIPYQVLNDTAEPVITEAEQEEQQVRKESVNNYVSSLLEQYGVGGGANANN
ncbi:hypothetical protein FACS1894125_0360 [Actinomycetota bacterium]|nr:hypothetical protein FACS1894125_0360 [Actinomycetota bacterium]